MKKLAIILIAAFVFFGCQEKKETTEDQPKTQTEEKAKLQTINADHDGVQITNAWVRPAAKNRNTGIFFNVVNNSDKKVTIYEAKSDLAEKTQIHETFKKSNNMMGMRELEYIVVEPGKTFQFKPMSHHVMLINLNKDLAEGDSVEFTLVYDDNKEMNVKAKVKDNMPSIRAADKKEVEK